MKSPTEITVGPANADIIGTDSRAIQMAVDALAWRGGGTVRVLPGEYVLTDSIHLRSHVALLGDRDGTILRLCPQVMSPLAADADIGQKEIHPASTAGFAPGMGVVLRDKDGRNDMASMPLTVTRVADGVLYLNDWIVTNFKADEGGGFVTNYFPLVHGFEIEGATVDGFTLDAGPDRRDALAGMWGGAVYLRRCRNSTLRNLVARNCVGDGIRFGQSEHITVEDCEACGNTEYGIHAGSHSPWTIVRRCQIHDNESDGLYLCWGIRFGVFEDNRIHHNGSRKKRNGICIGHKDTDNLIARNHIYENVKHGIHFRVKTEANGAHRNIVRENIIDNNGPADDGTAVHIEGVTHDLLFERNLIRDTRPGDGATQKHAFVVKPGATRIKLVGNQIVGHPGPDIVDESHSPDNDFQGLA